METKNFKVSKKGRYFDIRYLKYTPPSDSVFYYTYDKSVWETNRASAEKFMNLVIDIEPLVIKELKSQALSHNPNKIIASRLKTIESISSGIDIRSHWSAEKISENIVDSFNKQYVEAKEKCENILIDLKNNPVTYWDKSREFDEYKRLNNLFELGLESTDNFYSEPVFASFDKISMLLDKMSNILDENKLKNE